MGCGSSKHKKSEVKRISYDLSATYTLQMDQFFDQVKDCLKAIEQLRSDIEDSRDNLLKDSYAIYLKSPNLKEALRIMFWCISANHNGHIQQCKPKLQISPPYLTMKLSEQTKQEVQGLWRYFSRYLDAVKNGPLDITLEIAKYEEYVAQCNDFMDNGIDEILSVHETPMQKTQAALNISRNITRIKDQASAIKRVKEVIEEARKEAEKITDFIEELINSADEVGSKASKEGWFTPEEICGHYHPQLTKDFGDGELHRSRSDTSKISK